MNVDRYGEKQNPRPCPIVDGRFVSFMTCHACPWKGDKMFGKLNKEIKLKVYTKEIYDTVMYSCKFEMER